MDMYLITVEKFEDVLKYNKNKVYLIDVRGLQEYLDKHIEGAVHIAAADICEIECGNYSLVRKLNNIRSYGFVIILYCKSGVRSMRCVKILRDYGVECFSLHGGTDRYGI